MIAVARISRLVPLVVTAIFSLSVSAHAVTINWVTVGDPGNAADTTGNPNPAGAVADEFRIMKYEWTNSQYVDFLNAVDPDGLNPQDIYSADMGSNARGGISFASGNSPGSKYAARTNMGDKQRARPPLSLSLWERAGVRVPRTMKSYARTTPHGLRGRNSWPGWGRSFRLRARTAAATSG